jgi:hypothetical protein
LKNDNRDLKEYICEIEDVAFFLCRPFNLTPKKEKLKEELKRS